MTTPETIISRLRYDFDCRLTTQQILDIINVLEKRLAVDIVRKTQTITYKVVPDCNMYDLDIDHDYVTRVFVNDQEIKKRYSYNSEGYICEDAGVVFSKSYDSGTIYVEHLVVPEEITEGDMSERELFLGDGHDEIYLYHVLSREALMSGNIDMVNNYSMLYAEALNSLKAEVANYPKAEEPEVEKTQGSEAQNFVEKYNNVW